MISDRRGRHLLVVVGADGPDPAVLAGSIGKVANVTWLCDNTTMSADAVLAVHGREPFDGMLTFSESSLELAADLGQRLGLQFESPEAVRRLLDRHLQRQALADAGVPGPRFRLITSSDQIEAAASHVGFPAVVKQTRVSGREVIMPVDSVADVRAAWGRVADDVAAPRLILEEMLFGERWHDGEYWNGTVTVESLVTHGAIEHLAIGDTLPTASGLRSAGRVYPSTLPAGLRLEITAMVDAALHALEVTEGVLHTEVKLTAAGPMVIEVSRRLVEELWLAAPWAGDVDVDVIADAARAALRLDRVGPPEFSRYAAMLMPCIDLELAGRPVRVTVDPTFARRPGVHGVGALHRGVFEVLTEEGHALRAYVSGYTPRSIREHLDALQAAMSVQA